jgi:hypothetical protein
MKYKLIGISFAWLILGLINTLILRQFIDLNIGVLIVHSEMLAATFFGLSFGIFTVIKFGNFSALSIIQKIINYSFFAICIVGIWLGVGFLFDNIFFGNEIAKIFSELIIIYVPIGLMLFVIISQMIVIEQDKLKNDGDFDPLRYSREDGNLLQNQAIAGQARNDTPLKQIAVKSNSKIDVLSVDEIYFLSSDGDYVLINTENSKFLKEQTMKYFELHLPENFIRIHRSYIVNSQKISRVELLEKQTYYLILKNNQRIKMSVSGYKLLRQKLGM